MPNANTAALEFLKGRRSRPAKTLTGPVPDRAAVFELLTIAARSPDHGKLEPWRFLVLAKPALGRLADTIPVKGAELGIDPDKIEKVQKQFAD
ncbi:MAG: nitroreductase, partial [Boseongicola sp.]